MPILRPVCLHKDAEFSERRRRASCSNRCRIWSSASFLANSIDVAALQRQVDCVEDQDVLRGQLSARVWSASWRMDPSCLASLEWMTDPSTLHNVFPSNRLLL